MRIGHGIQYRAVLIGPAAKIHRDPVSGQHGPGIVVKTGLVAGGFGVGFAGDKRSVSAPESKMVYFIFLFMFGVQSLFIWARKNSIITSKTAASQKTADPAPRFAGRRPETTPLPHYFRIRQVYVRSPWHIRSFGSWGWFTPITVPIAASRCRAYKSPFSLLSRCQEQTPCDSTSCGFSFLRYTVLCAY
jgi:hypothetical protein